MKSRLKQKMKTKNEQFEEKKLLQEKNKGKKYNAVSVRELKYKEE